MRQASTVIYRLNYEDDLILTPPEVSYELVHWKPGIYQGFRSKRFPFKYNIFWFYHFLGVFKNNNYSAILLKDKEVIVGAMLVIPAYYRWPFMKNDDVQFTYVITHPEYRGKGIGKSILQQALYFLKEKNIDKIWYVTNEQNVASMKLCEKVGFSFVGYGFHKIALGGVIKRLFLKEEINHISSKQF